MPRCWQDHAVAAQLSLLFQTLLRMRKCLLPLEAHKPIEAFIQGL